MMDKSQYQTERKQLFDLLAPAMEGLSYQLTFGWGDDGFIKPSYQHGWWLIVDDYPSFATHFLGSTFGEAESTIYNEWLEEPDGEGW